MCQMVWHTPGVHMTLDLDGHLVQALLARHPGLSITEAIQLAVRSYLADDAGSRLRHLAGSLHVEDLSADLRAADRRT